ncbi:MAG TPA: TolC family protein [Myxococcaceae bacterium]|nr:TolC family protein [Myxococcaceae bacterium]
MIAALALTTLLLGQAPEGAAVSGEGPLLTLDQAIARAKEHNLDLQVARARLEQAKVTSRKVWAAYLPQLSVGGSYTRNNVAAEIPFVTSYYIRNVGQNQGPPGPGTEPFSPENPPGTASPYILYPAAIQQVTIQQLNQLGAQAQLNQALIAPALFPAIRNAYLVEEVAELSVENARREILFGVAQLYYGAAGLKEAIRVQERLLEINRDHEKDARVRFEAGAAPKAALLRAEIDRARSEQEVRRAQNAYLSAKVALATLLDRDTSFSVEVPPDAAQPQDAAGLEKKALERPDVEAARLNVQLAEGQRTGVLMRYLPNLGLNAVYRYANVAGFIGRNDSWAVTLGLNWTLFDGGLREAELKESGARIAEAEANRRSLERRAQDEVTRAKLDLDSAQANRVKAAEQLRLARENMELVNVSYKAGVATYLEVSDASFALLGAELNAVAEGLNANLAVVRLLRAAGQFNP